MGTEKAYDIYSHIQHELENLGIELLFDTMVTDFIVEVLPDGEKKAKGVIIDDNRRLTADHIVVGIGREGSEWLSGICHKYSINSKVGPVDIGLRIETSSSITEEIDKTLYEAKLVYYSPTFEDKVRTFCWNPRGEVVEERYGDSLTVVNGHSYKDESLKTSNTNFALLVSKNFTQPFKTPEIWRPKTWEAYNTRAVDQKYSSSNPKRCRSRRSEFGAALPHHVGHY
jgi:uncharacterized FAD-dependent dehydrogenase